MKITNSYTVECFCFNFSNSMKGLRKKKDFFYNDNLPGDNRNPKNELFVQEKIVNLK